MFEVVAESFATVELNPSGASELQKKIHGMLVTLVTGSTP